ncbi:MAG: RDD family protein [Bacteriovoracaceae bacterium]|nr:RDD family protein [Bacteriovoracaceae bacterium]
MNNKEINELFDGKIKFKPLTSGLGFHHQKTEVKAAPKKIHIPTTVELKIRENSLAQSLEKASQIMLGKEEGVDRGDLSPFYSKSQNYAPTKEMSSEVVLVSATNENAETMERLSAWFVDMAIILVMFGISVLAIVGIAASSSTEFTKIVTHENIWLVLSPISFFYYFFYFTFLDKSEKSTIGKNLMKLKTVAADTESKIDIYQTSSRTFVVLFNILTFGIGGLLDLQNKLTQTRVIQNQ